MSVLSFTGGNIAAMVRFVFFSACIQAAVCDLCWYFFMWCFPQFSALYPEMVDAVILLDSLGFIPANAVITGFYGQYSV